MSISNNKTSHLISTQVPEFVRDDHETFVKFLEEYYKFLEQETGLLNVTKNHLNNIDIDLSNNLYLEKLYDNFISLLPKNILADKTLILKHVKDFYRSRGSEKSVRFLMRILLNKEVEFYYPKRDVLRTSDGKWYVQRSIRVGDIAVNNTSNSLAYNNFVNKRVVGKSTGASAIVEYIDSYYDNGQLVRELQLSNEYKSFTDGETVECFFEEEGETKYLSANLFSGVVVSVSLANGGFGYVEGASVPVEGGGGSGAQVIIASTSKGSLSSIGIQSAGAGFRANDNILVTGGGGSGATAIVQQVDLSEKYHPNTYSIIASQIYLEANTNINNTRYSNLVSTIINPFLYPIANSMKYWTYSNCGPLQSCIVVTVGSNYTSQPKLTVQSNTEIRLLGILGRMEIVNGGTNYQVGDTLNFINPRGCYGVGAAANVTEVDVNGSITEVKWQEMMGHVKGGAGYHPSYLPTVTVNSANGTNASIVVKCLLGEGDSLITSSGPSGQILELKLISGGSGYTTAPTINLANMQAGSGGIATASIVSGAFTYPGRFLNDDGFLSSYNFLQDRDYYQNYSYVIRVNDSVNKYRKAIKDLVHPAGTKLFGDYLLTDANAINATVNLSTNITNTKLVRASYITNVDDVILTGNYIIKQLNATYAPRIIGGRYNISSSIATTYTTSPSSIIISNPNNNIGTSSNIYLRFISPLSANVVNGYYAVAFANQSHIIVPTANANSTLYYPSAVGANLTFSTGSGTTNSYVFLSGWAQNSNISIAVGDTITSSPNTATIVQVYGNSTQILVSPAFPGNLSSKAFTITKKPYYPSGNVVIFNPTIDIFANSSGLIRNDRAYFRFLSNDTSLQNNSYQVLFANATQLRVRHKDILNAASFSGNVNIHSTIVNITSNYHGINNTESILFSFYTGDTSNAVNSYYTVSGVTENTFNIVTSNSVVTGGSAYIRLPNIKLTVADHGFANTTNVRVWFTDGDTANVTNGIYTVSVNNSNEMWLKTSKQLTSNGNVSIYRGYSNVLIHKVAHGLNVGNTSSLLVDTGNVERISNGVFEIIDANTDYYTIKHTNINVSSNLINLLPNNSGYAYVS